MENQVDDQQLTIAAYKDMFATEKGKRVLKELKGHCYGGDLDVLFDNNSARITDYRLGKYDVYRHIMWMLKRKTEKKPEKVIS